MLAAPAEKGEGMMDAFWGALGFAAVILAFFGGIALVIWACGRAEKP